MNSNSPEDRLLDELLREQAKGPDEDFLKQIEAAVDAGPNRKGNRLTRPSNTRLAIAASIGLFAGISTWTYLQNRSSQQAVALNGKDAVDRIAGLSSEELNKAIRDQEDKVEERRKALTAIARTKGIIYKGSDSFYGQSGVDEDQGARTALETYTQLEREKMQLEGQLQSLDKLVPKSELTLNDLSEPTDNFGDLAANDVSSLKASSPSSRGKGMGAGMGLGLGGRQTPKVPSQESTPPTEPASRDRYGRFIDQPWKSPARDPLSTFSIDVDTASYSNVRRMIQEGQEIPRDAVRIEECINAFSYHYQQPIGDAPFAVSAALAACPWAPTHQLVRVAIKGREIDKDKRPSSNLVFLVDVSGSMQSSDKLPLLKQSMSTLVEQLDDRDRVAIVVYAGSEGVVLPSTRLDSEGRATVLKSLASLEAGGSTNGGAGIKRAYELAMKEKIDGGVNRVILASDGDFNVGVTGQQELVELVKERAQGGIYLTVLGFGTGNLNDAMMDAITRDGNGNYFYIDSEREGRKVFLEKLSGTLVTIAKDVKIQVEFNPAKVGTYRLIGYSNRVLQNEDFSNDKVDAGDIGAGHSVTAFYELTPPGVASNIDGLKYQPAPSKMEATDEWLTVKLRHKHPDGNESRLIEFPLTGEPLALDKTGADFQFATAAALFGMKLRGMDEAKDISWDKVLELAKPGLAEDSSEDRAEFVGLVKKLSGTSTSNVPAPAEVVPGDGK
jgi:secreted protein with Ig-like and vWFA domain